jgi:hypothetical protein
VEVAMLVELLAREAVPFETLHTRYGSLLELVRRVMGVVPNCDPYLEIWPTAFRTYNVMVPNLLNLPFMMWGAGAPRATVGWRCTWRAARPAVRTAPPTRARSPSAGAPASSRWPGLWTANAL